MGNSVCSCRRSNPPTSSNCERDTAQSRTESVAPATLLIASTSHCVHREIVIQSPVPTKREQEADTRHVSKWAQRFPVQMTKTSSRPTKEAKKRFRSLPTPHSTCSLTKSVTGPAEGYGSHVYAVTTMQSVLPPDQLAQADTKQQTESVPS